MRQDTSATTQMPGVMGVTRTFLRPLASATQAKHSSFSYRTVTQASQVTESTTEYYNTDRFYQTDGDTALQLGICS